MVTINNGFDSACKSGPSRQVEYCRLGMERILEHKLLSLILVIAYSKGKMVATPHMKDQMILIMKRDFYKTGQMASFFKKMRIRRGFELICTRWRSLPPVRPPARVCIILKPPLSVEMAGTVDPETLRRCLSLWVMYYLTPKFCIVDRNSFVLTDAGKYLQFQNTLCLQV